jgi:small-conductance mechanosensitive channel
MPPCFWSWVLLFLLCAQPAAQTGDREQAEPTQLVLAGRTVFSFRAERSGYTPLQRRTAAAALIAELIEEPGALRVTREAVAEGERLLVDGREVFSVLATDVDELAGETLATLAEETSQRLSRALSEVRESRDWRSLSLALLRTLLTLSVAAALAWFLLRNHRRLNLRLGRLGQQRAQALATGELRVLWELSVVPLARGLAALIIWSLVALVVFLALERVLLEFPYSRPIGEHLQRQLAEELSALALEVLESLPGLAVALLIWLVARFLVGLVKRYFQAASQGQIHSHLAEAVTPLVAERLIAVLVWLGALVIAFPYIPGSSTGAFQGVSVFAGLMVSLGSSSLVGQMASGIVLAYSRAFRVGDYVRFGEHEGTVVAFNLLATKLRTNKNEEVSVPNSLFTNGTTVNFSRFARDEGAFLATKLTLGYDIPWRTVHQLLLGAARRTEGLLAEPAPYVLQTALSDFYIEYELRAAVVDPSLRARTLGVLLANVLDDFGAAGVQILSPHHRHLHGAVDVHSAKTRPEV